MPTQDWLRNEFHYGYDSVNILSVVPDSVRKGEEEKIGGSYREIFFKALAPWLKPDSSVLELGPGKGAWSRAILEHIPDGRLTTVDFQDVTPWLAPETYHGRLECHKVADNTFSCLSDNTFDVFWSFGVLCHQNAEDISVILKNALPKMKSGGTAIHEYADWDKLNRFGWKAGGVPEEFRNLPDNEIWWPRNSRAQMTAIAAKAGWDVITPDLDLAKRDSIILLKSR